MNVHPKVAAAGGAGVAVTLLVLLLAHFGITEPDTVVAAEVTLVSFLAGYIRSSGFVGRISGTGEGTALPPIDIPAAKAKAK